MIAQSRFTSVSFSYIQISKNNDTFMWLLLKPGPEPWTLKTWTLKNLDPEKPGP